LEVHPHWPDDVKEQIVPESLRPGVMVSEVAERHRLKPNHLSAWRTMARQGKVVLPAAEDAKELGAVIVDPLVSEPPIKKVSRPEIIVGAVTIGLEEGASPDRIAAVARAGAVPASSFHRTGFGSWWPPRQSTSAMAQQALDSVTRGTKDLSLRAMLVFSARLTTHHWLRIGDSKLANIIRKVAIHDLDPVGRGFEVKLGKNDLPITQTAQRVIDLLYSLYIRRASKSHGKFAEDEVNYPTQIHVGAYIDGEFADFNKLTADMMLTLKKEASQKNARGGHVFFSHFNRDGKDYLLVAIINDTLGAALTDDLEPTDVNHLDMDGFRFAGRINMTGWRSGEDRYISFLKGKGDIAEYFKEFLGCDTSVAERYDTQTLVKALGEYADFKGLKGEEKQAFLKKAKDICDRLSKSQEALSFTSFSNEMAPDAPEDLLDTLTDPERKLNDNFVPHRPSLARLVRFQARTKHWSLEFDREALQTGPISYDREANVLIIRDLPAELIAELRSDIDDG
jgi:nucleoid-associated protein